MNQTLFISGLFAFVASTLLYSESHTPESVKALTGKVADWQIEVFENAQDFRAVAAGRKRFLEKKGLEPEKWHDLTWHNAALYAGLNHFRRIADNPEAYTDFLKEIGKRNQWRLHNRPYHADDHAVGQMYLSLYEEFGDDGMISPTRESFDRILQRPKTGSLLWMTREDKKAGRYTDSHSRWGWCDALFMAPPVWARLAKVTGQQGYLDFMDQEYHATYDLLWDEEEGLFWRDSSFFPRREKNGEKLFWARGNGWVIGGLAMMMPDLPEEWEGRTFYTELFQQMAESFKDSQRSDGTWSMGLLGDETDYPIKESSGTSFITFGLAWGVNNGLLEREVYEPVILKAWSALDECVTPEGLLGYVQPVGAAPGDSFPDRTEVYGVGAFLAAGTEVYLMLLSDQRPETPTDDTL
ncbi:MAG: glycoside hydrolase family 88 protein [Verrucomicrobiota bacterium]